MELGGIREHTDRHTHTQDKTQTEEAEAGTGEVTVQRGSTLATRHKAQGTKPQGADGFGYRRVSAGDRTIEWSGCWCQCYRLSRQGTDRLYAINSRGRPVNQRAQEPRHVAYVAVCGDCGTRTHKSPSSSAVIFIIIRGSMAARGWPHC